MKRWTHPQDFIALLAGIYAMLAPIWTETTAKTTWTMVVLGAVTALLSLADLVRPDLLATEGLTALMGLLFFIAPWVMGFSGLRAMSWTAWIIGVAVAAVGLADLQMTRTHRGIATSH
jgi:uncharacterized membrane protein HdeD (DUF308 family)